MYFTILWEYIFPRYVAFHCYLVRVICVFSCELDKLLPSGGSNQSLHLVDVFHYKLFTSSKEGCSFFIWFCTCIFAAMFACACHGATCVCSCCCGCCLAIIIASNVFNIAFICALLVGAFLYWLSIAL